jgi:microcystin-dependent protein
VSGYKWITADKGSFYPEKIRFWTSNDATARMTVDSNGRVGLAYESPREQLDVSGNIRITNNYSYIGTRADGTTSNGLFNISAVDNNTYLNYGVGGSFNLRNNTNNTRLAVTDNLHIMTFGTGSGSTIFGVDNITIGNGTTSNQYAYIDLIGDSTYTDYGLRLLRNNTGPNSQSLLTHRGTGELRLITEDAAPFTVTTNSIERMRVTSDGSVGINTTTPNPAYKLDVNGNTNITGDLTITGKISIVPSGCIMAYGGSISPVGWVLCNGTSYSTSTYADLFAVIGYTYGGSGGSFNVPDMRDRFPIGAGSTYSPNSKGGSDTVTLAIENIPAHSHTGTTDANGSHSHSVSDPGHQHAFSITRNSGNSGGNPGEAQWGGKSDWGNYTYDGTTSNNSTGIAIVSNGSHTHTITTANTGSGTSFDIKPKYIGITYIIKV